MQCLGFISFAIFALAQAKRNPSKINVLDTKYSNETSLRIVGGAEAVPHSYPYQAALIWHGSNIEGEQKVHYCGGSIISKNYVLTSAECTWGSYIIKVVLGAHDISRREPTQIIYDVFYYSDAIIHCNNNWDNPNSKSFDLALIKLPDVIRFNDYIQPVLLPRYSDENKYLSKTPAVITGWGLGKDEVMDTLHFVNTKIISLKWCKLFFPRIIGKNHICTQGRGRKGASSTDIGGPMVIEDENGEVTLQGIVTHVSDFGNKFGWPTVFIKVSRFLQWIHENTGIIIRD